MSMTKTTQRRERGDEEPHGASAHFFSEDATLRHPSPSDSGFVPAGSSRDGAAGGLVPFEIERFEAFCLGGHL